MLAEGYRRLAICYDSSSDEESDTPVEERKVISELTESIESKKVHEKKDELK